MCRTRARSSSHTRQIARAWLWRAQRPRRAESCWCSATQVATCTSGQTVRNTRPMPTDAPTWTTRFPRRSHATTAATPSAPKTSSSPRCRVRARETPACCQTWTWRGAIRAWCALASRHGKLSPRSRRRSRACTAVPTRAPACRPYLTLRGRAACSLVRPRVWPRRWRSSAHHLRVRGRAMGTSRNAPSCGRCPRGSSAWRSNKNRGAGASRSSTLRRTIRRASLGLRTICQIAIATPSCKRCTSSLSSARQ
mmetsp:Transcript_8803/g.35984  ORF Transcript_8803/g.35984 Transcript_8803/m.35984 type:complete len:252 (-) Transcript_8803:2208-2963(-)